MVKFKIKNIEIQEILKGETPEFPKYSTQLMNLANSNAQGTRPKVVGQLSDLIQEFDGLRLDDWEKWYKNKMPNAIDNAVEKIHPMVENLKTSIEKVDKALIKKWVEDLVIDKTFMGLKFQEAILNKIATSKGVEYRLAEPKDESKGIDGYIDNKPVSIKSISYQSKVLSEKIDVPIIYYDKKKDGISIEFDL